MANLLTTRFPAPPTRSPALAWPNEHADGGYVLLVTGRCGSSHLADLLAQTGVCGAPGEFFNEAFLDHDAADWHGSDVPGYVAQLVSWYSQGRRFGFKIDGLRHRWLSAVADPLALFPPAAFGYVYLNRRNLVEQAFSFAHAKRGGAWHRMRDVAEVPASHDPATITDRELWQEIAMIVASEAYLEGHLREHALPVVRIDYEMLCASETYVVANVMQAAGRTYAEIDSAILRMSPRHMKIDYPPSKTGRLLAFQAKHAAQLEFLAGQRGRPLNPSLQQFFGSLLGIDIARV